MSTRRPTNEREHASSVVLVCTACEHTWEPDLLNPTDRSEATSTDCPLCGGWTWIGEITEPGDGWVPLASPTTSRSTTR